MADRKVLFVVTARASYSRIRSALIAVQKHPDLELQLVVAASALLERYGSAAEIIEQDGFKIDEKVYFLLDGETPLTSAKSVGLGVSELATTFSRLRPDVVVTVADRYETLATAIAASYLNIPLVHVQGGEMTGSIDEKVRHAVTKLADLHLVSTNQARQHVIRMGELPSRVIVTGCPSIDIAATVAAKPELDFDPFEKYGGTGDALDLSRGYIVGMQHPVTTEHEDARWQIEETLYAVRTLGLPVLWFWPNPDSGSNGTSKGIRLFRELAEPKGFHWFRNMMPEDFLRLLINAAMLVGNSSVGIRECSYLGVPVVNIGTRQQGRERGRNVIDVDHDQNEIIWAMREQLAHDHYEPDTLYGSGFAGFQIAEAISKAELTVEKRLTY